MPKWNTASVTCDLDQGRNGHALPNADFQDRKLKTQRKARLQNQRNAKKDTASNTEKATEKQTTAASTKTAASTETASTKQTKNNTQDADDQQDETENSEYILPESDTRYVEQDEIDQLTKNEVRLAINEIYARHGRIFENSELREYFESKDWYDGTIEPEDFDEDVLNQYEKANVKLLADNK